MERVAALLVGLLLLTMPAAVGSAALRGGAEGAPGAAGAPDAGSGPRPHERYVVGFHALPRDLGPGLDYAGAEVQRVSGALHYAVVLAGDGAGFEARARADRNVRYVEPDPLVQLIRFTPDDPKFPDQYGPQHVKAPEAWDTTLGDTDAAVCVVDTGVRYTHEDLTGTRWKGGHDYVNGDTDPWDDNGHGTHVAGSAAAGVDNGKGIAGIGNVALYGVKVLNSQGSGTLANVAAGIEWCADNAGSRVVISLSLGSGTGSQTLLDAVQYAEGKGALIVAAAGNDGPCSDCIDYPAKYAEVMAITCTTSSKAQCSFSSDGPESELAAPGNGIESTYYSSDTSYTSLSGTSMSTPHVSGVAALVWSDVTTLTAASLRQHLKDEAQDLGDPGWDELFGHGLVDANATLAAAKDPAPPEQRVSFEDFDDGSANGWTLGGLWHVSESCSTPPSTPKYLGYNQDSDCEYSTGSRTTGSARFDVDLAGATAGTLKFDHRWETESYANGAYDIMRVQVSTDGGSTWTTLKQWDSRDANQLDWKPASFDLDAYTGGTAGVRFFFDSVDGVANNFDGWFLDNVEVTANTGGGQNQPPVASAGPDQTLADDDGSGAESVTLDGTASSDPDGTIASYEWHEGGTLLATGATPTVSLAVGAHTVTLTVTDDDGATDTDDVVITVNANQAPTASFTASCTNLDCTFDGSASSDPDGTITSYAWDFGDGATGSGVTASHSYAAAGTYTVKLTVTDNGGKTASTTKSVTVTEPPSETKVYGIDFEDGADGWHQSGGTTDLWRRATGCLGANSGSYAIMFNKANNDCVYSTGSQSIGWARSPVVDLSGYTEATLKFYHAWETESYANAAYDIMRVQVSDDGGSTWTTIKQWDSRDANQLTFKQVELDVGAYISSQFRARFHFDSVDQYSNGYDGWHVDDVEVWAS